VSEDDVANGEVEPRRRAGSHGDDRGSNPLLRASEDRFRLLVANVVDYGIFMLDPGGHITSWNAGAERMYAYTESEILGKHFSIFYPAADITAGKCERELEIVKRDGRFEEEGLRIRKDGSEFWANVVITPVRDASGSLVGFGKVTRDLTVRQRADQELRRSEERLRLLISSVKDYAIFILDPDGHVATWNPGAERLKGYSTSEIVGRHFSAFYPEEDVRRGKCEHELEVAQRLGRLEDEGWRIRKDGSRFWANVVITPIRDERQALVGFAKVTRDLSDRKRHEEERLARVGAEEARRLAELNQARANAVAEELRQARDKAQQASRLKDDFLATVSHELRTPLHAILGWARMLEDGALTPEKRVSALQTITRNALAQTQIIDDLLDVSRIIAGQLRLDVDLVDINQIVGAAIDVVRPAAEAKGVALQWMLNPDAGVIKGDAGRLQQILWNLLTNAVKFTPRGGRVHVTLHRADSYAQIDIADTGKGIAPQFLSRVFDRFTQQDASNTRTAGGLGLGLAIVKHLVELHGGTVEAFSEGENTGATFTVRIPFAPVRVPQASSPSTVPPLDEVRFPDVLRGLHVLVVDDEPDARELVQVVLERGGATVTLASTGAQALECIGERKPDVIVSDIGIPDEDGYVFIRKLRALPPEAGGRIPAVALTAYARAEDRRKALVAGFQNHAGKPIEPHELVIVVANLAGRYS
jgi:PAS domain S-box-containing protein